MSSSRTMGSGGCSALRRWEYASSGEAALAGMLAFSRSLSVDAVERLGEGGMIWC